MYPLRMVRQALRLGLLVTLVVLAMSACGGAGSQEEQANKPRHLPQNNATLRPGEYHSQEFEPSLSFRVGKGWEYVAPELSDKLSISQGGGGGDPLLNADGSNVTQITKNSGKYDSSADWQPLPRTVHPPDTGGPSLLLAAGALFFSGGSLLYAVVRRRMYPSTNELNFGELREREVRRIYLLRGWVNTSLKRNRGPRGPPPSLC
jgi:hypothetical protein